MALVREVGFDRVNTAAYSPRPNTPAAVEANQVGLQNMMKVPLVSCMTI